MALDSTPPPDSAALPAPPCAFPPEERTRWFMAEVHPHEGLLKRWLRRRFPTLLHDIDDIVNDAHVRLWKRIARRPIQFPRSFLFVTARNVAINRVNKASSAPFTSVGELDSLEVLAESSNGADLTCRQEEIELLMQAIEQLSPRTREVYMLRQLERLPHKEIASRLGISTNTVEIHISRANKCCEQFLRDHGVIEDTP